MNELKQLKAAAGSGKTYALTERFLALMEEARNEGGSLACAASPASGYCWPEILAATFTNKAAAEMKERIVASIKRAALDIPEGQRASWPPARAEKTLDRLLRRYNQLGIRTIDSLLNLLLRVFALDAGLTPDFDIIFDAEEPFTAAMDRIVAACRAGDPDLAALYGHCLRTALRDERDSQGNLVSGFAMDKRIRAHLFKITSLLMEVPEGDSPVLTDQQEIADLLVPHFDGFNQALASLYQCIEGHGLDADKRFLNFLAKCEGRDLFDGPPDSKYASKSSLEECVKKASRPLVSPAAETCYHDFSTCHARYAAMHALLSRAYGLAPAVELARRVLALMREEEGATGCVLSSTMAGRVRELLDGEYGVPDAFCRMGSRLHHLLIDEFQDTSRDQWGAIVPLAEECLSKGGSLFYVGDVKQAIYGWRGGDATLFDEVATDSELVPLVEAPVRENLERNWRSQGHIVRFNNDIFTGLARLDVAEPLADALLRDAPDQCKARFCQALDAAYSDATQNLPDGTNEFGGYVRMEQLPGGSAGDVETQSLDAAEELISGELAERRKLSDICVLVRKGEHAELLCDRLVARGVPVVTESSLRLNLHPVVRQLAALLSVVDHPADDMALAELLLGELFLHRTGLKRDELLLWMATRHARGQAGPLHLAFREAYPEAWNRCLAPFVSKAGLMTAYDLASDGAEALGVLEVYPDSELFLRRFLELVHGSTRAGTLSLGGFLELWRERGDEEKVALPETVDAVRIMTMHKAKGLQFPVVVVPFLHWSMPSDSPLRIMEVDGNRVIAPLTKGLGEPYHEERRIQAQEQLNLLYVAFTRAEEELYAFTPREVRAAAPAHAALDLLLELDEDQPLLEFGTPAASTISTPPAPASPTPGTLPVLQESRTDARPELMAWLPRLRVHKHMEETGFDARMRGETAHRAMEYLLPPVHDEERQEAALRARTMAMQDFPLIASIEEEEQEQLGADLDSMLLWVLGQDDLCSWLASGKSEASFLDADGHTKRPDFLHLGEKQAVILEFKTGQREARHAQQTRDYMRMAAQAFGRPARGVVVYLDLRALDDLGIQDNPNEVPA